MRLVRVQRRFPHIPAWAIALVLFHLALVGLYVLLSAGTGEQPAPLCNFRRLTGLPCPTCGTTRMVLALGRADFTAALAYNPLALLLLAVAVAWLVLRTVFRRRIVLITSTAARRAWTTVLIVLVLANWAYLITCLPA